MATAKPKTEMVTIHLFKDKDKYKHDLKVGLNGRIWRIKRGMDVQVPKEVYEIIRNSMEQDNKTADLISAKVKECETAVKNGNI